MPLDRKILELAATAKRPVELAEALRRDGYPDVSTQRVASRLKALVARGLAVRVRPAGGPRNGPGTSLYKVREESPSDG